MTKISTAMVEAGVSALQAADGEPDAAKVANVYAAMEDARQNPNVPKANDHVAYRDMDPPLPVADPDDAE